MSARTLLSVALAAFAAAPTSAERVPEPFPGNSIVCIGDSLTSWGDDYTRGVSPSTAPANYMPTILKGYGANIQKNYPFYLAGRIGTAFTVLNMSKAGGVTDSIMAWFGEKSLTTVSNLVFAAGQSTISYSDLDANGRSNLTVGNPTKVANPQCHNREGGEFPDLTMTDRVAEDLNGDASVAVNKLLGEMHGYGRVLLGEHSVTRLGDCSEPLTIPIGTRFTPDSAYMFRKSIHVIFTGTNDQAYYVPTVGDVVKQYVDALEDPRYIVITSHYAPNLSQHPEAHYQELFGKHYIALYDELRTNGVKRAVKLGLVAAGTSQDDWQTVLTKGASNPHFNDIGCQVMADVVYEKLQTLGYLDGSYVPDNPPAVDPEEPEAPTAGTKVSVTVKDWTGKTLATAKGVTFDGTFTLDAKDYFTTAHEVDYVTAFDGGVVNKTPNGTYASESTVKWSNLTSDLDTEIFVQPYAPIVPRQTDSPDPCCTKDPTSGTDRWFYTWTTGSNVQLGSSTTFDTFNGTRTTVAVGASGYTYALWAPEIRYVQGNWYMYYSASSQENTDYERSFVMRYTGTDSSGLTTDSNWEIPTRLVTPDDKWAIDGTVFEANGKAYYVWSGWVGDANVQQNIYLAPMETPTTFAAGATRTLVSQPTEAWETVGSPKVNEGPAVLQKNGKVIVVYSGSGSWTTSYALGYVTCSDGNFTNASSWKKHSGAVFSQRKDARGPGHCTFTQDAEGQDYIVYHAQKDGDGQWVNRGLRIQPFAWHDDEPVFGAPRPKGTSEPWDYDKLDYTRADRETRTVVVPPATATVTLGSPNAIDIDGGNVFTVTDYSLKQLKTAGSGTVTLKLSDTTKYVWADVIGINPSVTVPVTVVDPSGSGEGDVPPVEPPDNPPEGPDDPVDDDNVPTTGTTLVVNRDCLRLARGRTFTYEQLEVGDSSGVESVLTLENGTTLQLQPTGNAASQGVSQPARLRILSGASLTVANEKTFIWSTSVPEYWNVTVSGANSTLALPKEFGFGGYAPKSLVVTDGAVASVGNNVYTMGYDNCVLAITNATVDTRTLSSGAVTSGRFTISGNNCLVSIAGADAHLDIGQIDVSGENATFAFEIPETPWTEAPVKLCWKVNTMKAGTVFAVNADNLPRLAKGESVVVPLVKTVQGVFPSPDDMVVRSVPGFDVELFKESNVLKVRLTGTGEGPSDPAENSWMAEPTVSPASWTEGEAAGTLSLGQAEYGTVTCDYTQEALNALAKGVYTVTFTVAATDDYMGLCRSVEVTVNEKQGGEDPAVDVPTCDQDWNLIVKDLTLAYGLGGGSCGQEESCQYWWDNNLKPGWNASAQVAMNSYGHTLWLEGADVTLKDGTYRFNQLELANNSSGVSSTLVVGEGATLALGGKKCSLGDPNYMWGNASWAWTLKVAQGGTLNLLGSHNSSAGTFNVNNGAAKNGTFVVDGGTVGGTMDGKLQRVGYMGGGFKSLQVLNGGSVAFTTYALDASHNDDGSSVTARDGTIAIDTFTVSRKNCAVTVGGANGRICGGMFTVSGTSTTLAFELPEKGWSTAPMAFSGTASLAEGTTIAVDPRVLSFESGSSVSVPLLVADSGLTADVSKLTVPSVEGYQFSLSADTTTLSVTVTRTGESVVVAAKIGEKSYATIGEACEAAQSGDVVKLVRKPTPDDRVVFKPGVTIDLNGQALDADAYTTPGEWFDVRSSETSAVIALNEKATPCAGDGAGKRGFVIVDGKVRIHNANVRPGLYYGLMATDDLQIPFEQWQSVVPFTQNQSDFEEQVSESKTARFYRIVVRDVIK